MSDVEIGHASLALLYTLPEGRSVWGVASLGDELFVVRERASDVEVYRYASLYRRLEVPRLVAARDLAACHVNSCLFITDVGDKRDDGKTEQWRRYAIHRSVHMHLAVLYLNSQGDAENATKENKGLKNGKKGKVRNTASIA